MTQTPAALMAGLLVGTGIFIFLIRHGGVFALNLVIAVNHRADRYYGA
ncbi:hypothetical protein [Limnohabitans curvus]|jgi:hypothetical protein|nr:hypothetical protein [Limnohabitans curvus]